MGTKGAGRLSLETHAINPVYLPSLQAHGISPADILIFALGDKLPNGVYMDALVLLTDTRLCVIWGCEPGKRTLRFGAFAEASYKKKTDEPAWREHHYEEFALESCGKMTSSRQVTGATVLLERGEDEIRLFSHTNILQSEISRFIKLYNKKKEGEAWTEEDLHRDTKQSFCPNCGMKYPDEHRTVCPKCMDKRSVMLRLTTMLKPYAARIALMLGMMLLISLSATLEPYMSGRVLFDQVLKPGGQYYGQIGLFVGIMVLLRVTVVGLNIIMGRTSARIGSGLIYDLKTRIFAALQRLSLSFFSRQQTGKLMTRVNRDSMRILYFFLDGVPYFIQNALTILFVFGVMFSLDWRLSLFVLIPFPVVVYAFQIMFPKFIRLWQKENAHQSRMNALIADSLKGARVLKAFGKEEVANKRFAGINEGLRGVITQTGRLDSLFHPLFTALIGMSLLTIWGYGGWQVLHENMSFGVLISFTGFIGMLYDPLDFMVWIVRWYSDSMTSAQRMFEIIDTPPEVAASLSPVRLNPMVGDLVIKNVSFGYEPGKMVLKDVNVEIKSGQMLGIVGKSGAGKSTLASLICRLYDPTEGAIFIDGVNLRDVLPSDLTSQISVVSQETYIFMGSVADNISYARPDCDRRDIVAAAIASGAHEFIMKLPEGYDTILGSNGRDLSGGERQRVSIARALLQDPRIIILDEATSAVDTQTERIIQNAIEMLAKGRTTISIAHRLSTLRNADHLIVLEEGKIVEAGTHIELIKKKGVFFKLMQLQSEALKFRGVGGE